MRLKNRRVHGLSYLSNSEAHAGVPGIDLDGVPPCGILTTSPLSLILVHILYGGH